MSILRHALAALALAACAAPPASLPPPEPVLRVLSEAIHARTAMEELASNAQAWGPSISNHGRHFDSERVHERIPTSFDPQVVRAQAEGAVSRIGLTTGRLDLGEVPAAPRVVPETASAEEGFALEDADVLAEIPVTLEVSPPDREKARALRAELRRSGPLWKWDRVTRDAKGLRISARVFAFRDVKPPRYVIESPDLEEDLKRAGAPPFGELSSGPHRAMAAEIQGEYVRRAAAKSDAEPGLVNLARLQLLDARYAAFKRVAQAVEGESFTELLE